MRILLFLLLAPPVAACTLWGAAGDAAGGGTLLAKNRDWRPDHQQSLRVVHSASGAAYAGLFADNGRAPGLKAGVNQYGLAVVSASAGSLAKSDKNSPGTYGGVMRSILQNERQIDGVIARAAQYFGHARPMFLLLADRRQLLQVEIAPGGHYSLQSNTQNVTSHTNHYLSEALQGFNYKIGPSSQTRLARIQSLLGSGHSPWQLSDFSRISLDQADGPDNSLWRQGREYTLAGWQLALPASGTPALSVRLANPGQPVLQQQWQLDDAFWQAPARTLLP